MNRFWATAQDHRVAWFDAQRTRVGGYVGTWFVDDANDTQGHSYPANAKPIGTVPLGHDLTDRIGQICNSYETVQIGEQLWIKENLRTKNFTYGGNDDVNNYEDIEDCRSDYHLWKDSARENRSAFTIYNGGTLAENDVDMESLYGYLYTNN